MFSKTKDTRMIRMQKEIIMLKRYSLRCRKTMFEHSNCRGSSENGAEILATLVFFDVDVKYHEFGPT